MSQFDLARITGISPRTISRYEKGKSLPSIERVWIIAQALGKPVEFFFDKFTRKRPLKEILLTKVLRVKAKGGAT